MMSLLWQIDTMLSNNHEMWSAPRLQHTTDQVQLVCEELVDELVQCSAVKQVGE
jgi:hypothetical protein